MLRWYCWLIFFAIAILSTWTFPVDGDVGERNLAVAENGNEQNGDVTIEGSILNEDDDDDDDEGLVENGISGIADRHLKRKKNHKNTKKIKIVQNHQKERIKMVQNRQNHQKKRIKMERN